MDEIEKEGTKGIELLTKLVQLTQKTKKELADNPEKVKISRNISGKKMIKTRVPECPQCTKLNQNDPQDQGISLGGPLGAQDPPK